MSSFDIYLVIMCVAFTFSLIASFIIYKENYIAGFKRKVTVDISVENMKAIEKIVSDTKEKYSLNDDSTLKEFANALHIKEGKIIKIKDANAIISSKQSDGYNYVDFSKNLSEIDKRYAFAHECGHVLNGDLIPNTKQFGHGKPESEQRADYAAAAIIMPIGKVERILKDMRFEELNSKEKKNIILKMTQMFQVTESSAIKRINEVRLLNCIE